MTSSAVNPARCHSDTSPLDDEGQANARLNALSFRPVAADGQALPFRDGSFDAVLCQLGPQFFPDPAKGLAEFRRVLHPGSRAAVCVISTADRAPMRGILADTLVRFLPERRNLLNLSFSLGDETRLETLLADAGFRDIHVERETRTDTLGSFDEYWLPIEAGTGSIPQCYLALDDDDRRLVRDEAKAKLAQFGTEGKLTMSVELLIGRGHA
nr:methyltransferase domain-containing protein [uncultured Rhodopila sp.]